MGATLLQRFREQLYQNLSNRADTLLDLLDALSGNTTARSVVELSLSPAFRRHYSALYKAVADYRLPPEVVRRLVAPAVPPPRCRPFWLFSLDVTPCPRPYAPTLADRGMVYAPQVVRSNKPVTVGHQYSSLVVLPERKAGDPPWVVPLEARRVSSQEDKEMVGAEQLTAWLQDPHLPFREGLCLLVADTAYSKPPFLLAHTDLPNLVKVVRVRSNRVFYRRHRPAKGEQPRRGHPRWYGGRFALNDPSTWHPPDAERSYTITGSRGQTYSVRTQAWEEMVMRGSKDLPMHNHPFTLVRVEFLRPDGCPLFRRPLWLILFGPRHQEVDLQAAVEAYRQRFDHEHFFRFAKRRLLLTAYQTPDVAHEEAWWQIVFLAYLQLWLARPQAQAVYRPWEQYLPQCRRKALSPAQVQRDFARILRPLGTPARPVKRRGNSPGRPQGYRLTPRPRYPVVRKARKTV